MVRLHNTTEHVDSILCKDAGLSEPDTFEKCGGVDCARWISGEWTLCLQSHCQSRNIAIQNRNVQCLFRNGTESDACDPNERPITRQECSNERCKPYWRMDKWTDVGQFAHKIPNTPLIPFFHVLALLFLFHISSDRLHSP